MTSRLAVAFREGWVGRRRLLREPFSRARGRGNGARRATRSLSYSVVAGSRDNRSKRDCGGSSRNDYDTLKSPLCSCVSIRLPVPSETRIAASCDRLKNLTLPIAFSIAFDSPYHGNSGRSRVNVHGDYPFFGAKSFAIKASNRGSSRNESRKGSTLLNSIGPLLSR